MFNVKIEDDKPCGTLFCMAIASSILSYFIKIKYGCKSFMLHYLPIVLHFGNAWFYIATTFIPIALQYTAFYYKVSTLLFTRFYGLLIHFNCPFIYQWTNMVGSLQRIANA